MSRRTILPASILLTTILAGGCNPGISGSEGPPAAAVVVTEQTGALGITVFGLPPGGRAAVTMSGEGLSRTIVGTETISGLPPGTYTVRGESVASGGFRFVPEPLLQTVRVAAGQVARSTVTYSTSTGSLTITVSGLPVGSHAGIQVRGPASFLRIVAGTETLTGLDAGTYDVSAGPVSAGSGKHFPQPAAQSIPVSAGSMGRAAVAYSAGSQATLIAVDSMRRYQVMEGWEAVAQAGQDLPGFTGWRSRLMDQAVNDLGLTRLRLEVRAGAENPHDHYVDLRKGIASNWRCQRWETVNDNADPNVIDPAGFHFSALDTTMVNVVLPFKQRVEARGERFTLNLTYVAFLGQCAPMPYVHEEPAEYAEFILAAFLHLRDRYGFTPDALELILEPDAGTPWNPTLMGRALVATAARLHAAGLHPAFIGPSTASMANAGVYFDVLQQVPGAAGRLSILSYHRYGGVSDANLAALALRGTTRAVRTAMLEHIGSGVEDLYRDLTLGGVSVWQQFTLAFPTTDNGAQYYPIQNGQPVLGDRTRFLRQYFRYVRPGAQRIAAASAHQSLRSVAFRNTDGRLVVVIHVDLAGPLTVRGLRPGTYGVSMTTGGATGTELGDQSVGAGGSLTLTVPTSGVLTVYGK